LEKRRLGEKDLFIQSIKQNAGMGEKKNEERGEPKQT